jgi:phenylalanyl-tRNA synthetase beta chain
MRVSLRWLRELLPEIKRDARLVAEQLTSIGLAVDAVHDLRARLQPLLVVEVRAIQRHPKRDQLSLVDVDRGAGQLQQVVCGASNVPEPGGLVLLAPLGTQLPGMDGPLTPREIGGVKSEGMLCSETELGVAEKSEGLLVFGPGKFKPGTRAIDALPELDDIIFDLDITPNRPDALSHVGIARDLAALLGVSFAVPSADLVLAGTEKSVKDSIEIDNQDGERCPIYGAAAAVDVKVGSSPDFMRWRLQRLGIRPISNVVDITNWMLLLFGQPMHAFDWDQLRGNRIVIRRAQAGEAFSTLDGVERSLANDDLLIADGEGPTALAGVMGGLHSEISASTTRILLECAYFTPQGVRRTARRHGLHTEASHRFERGVDWGQIELVLEHALGWLERIAGARRLQGVKLANGKVPARVSATLRFARLNSLLGLEVPADESVAILERLGFKVIERKQSEVSVVVPSHRPDVTREVDLIEEVARIVGLDQIPTRIPARVTQPARHTGQLEQSLTDIAVALGLSEALLYGFTSQRSLAQAKAPLAVVHLENPLTEERNVMRTSLVPGLLEALGRARRRGEPSVRLFAIGSVFLPTDTLQTATAERERPRVAEDIGQLPVEVPRFAAILAGPRTAWLKKPEPLDVFDAKGTATEIIERYLRRPVTVTPAPDQPHTKHLHPRGAADLFVGAARVGWLGPLHPELVDAFDLGDEAQLIELDLAVLETLEQRRPRYRPIIRVPGIIRDVSFEVPKELPAGDIVQAMAAAAGDLCESVEPFDLFEGGGVAGNCRAIAFRLTYRDPKAATEPDAARTLTDAEVDERQLNVVDAIKKQWGIALRG